MNEPTPARPSYDGRLAFTDSSYSSPPFEPSLLARLFPALYFYVQAVATVHSASYRINAGRYSDDEWMTSSRTIAALLERTGGRLELEGLDRLHSLKEPCLFIGNHMSTLETFLIPCIIHRWRPVTFVIKKGLDTYPVFGPLMRWCDPIVVSRVNPREDLSTVMKEGIKRLQRGISVVIFPQSTRMEHFDPSKFNTIGIKLAKKAGVPVVPMALRTDFWGNGKLIKDFGPVRTDRTVHIRFGESLNINGNGKAEHAAIMDFIAGSLAEWDVPVLA